MPAPSKIGNLSAERDEHGRFRPGARGGPGRRHGSRNRATLVLEKLLADDAEAVVRATVAVALEGDMQACRIVLDRVIPVRKGRPVALALPEIERAADVLRAQAAVVAAMADGEVSPDEAAVVSAVLEGAADDRDGGPRGAPRGRRAAARGEQAMNAAQRNRLARIEAKLPASPSPRAAEVDVEDLVGLSLDELLVRFEERGGPEARRRRAELDAMSDAELIEEFQRR